jgi:membrane-bound lytic murein transglycosylase D
MNKLIARFLIIIIILLLIIGIDFWVNKSKKLIPGTNEQYYKIVSLPIPDTLSFAGEMVPLDIFYVREALDRELSVNTYWHSSSLQIIKKAPRWFPVFDSIFSKYGIPSDFKYLGIIESGLSNAVSPSGAVGFWQFLKGTAKDYGLEVDNDVDERYNVYKETEAACKYFLDSYNKYKNWTLVAAAYNAGNNRISEFMETQKAKSYYDLLLSEETSRYIYRILAFKLIFEDPESYGFYIDNEDFYKPIPVNFVEVNNRIDSWADFAKEHGISYKLLKYFNPWLRDTDLRNRKKKTYRIMIPEAPYNITHEQMLDQQIQAEEDE